MEKKIVLKTHLAICTEPFLSLILSGEKKVESRFSRNRIAPYGKVSKGDVVILKHSGGEVAGSCVVQKAIFVEIKNKKIFADLKKQYSRSICADADPHFWSQRTSARYASFIWLGKITQKKIIVHSSGRSGWRILQ
jgi:ASC-1-like (ASCH) protein